MSEKTAWRFLKSKIIGPRDRADRIENLIVTGMPDTSICIDGKESWIEIKAPQIPRKPTTPLFGSSHKVSQAQKNWFTRQAQAGGYGYIYVETTKHRYLMRGEDGNKVNDWTVAEMKENALWESAKPNKPEDWQKLRRILCRLT